MDSLDNFVISISRSSSTAIVPSRASERSPGYDLFADSTVWLKPFESKYIHTGWHITIPRETFGRVISKRANNSFFSIGSEILESDCSIPLKAFIINKTN